METCKADGKIKNNKMKHINEIKINLARQKWTETTTGVSLEVPSLWPKFGDWEVEVF